MHRNTPQITVYDARGAVARTVAYCRRSAEDDSQAYVSQTVDDFKHRARHSRDPRLFALFRNDPSTPANETSVTSLSGASLLSVNSDAGWRLSLSGASGLPIDTWDQKLNHHRIDYDQLLRPASFFEHEAQGAVRRSECFSYADSSAESASHNRCGQLIRHDDTAGTENFDEFSLLGLPLKQARQFLDTLDPPDWPQSQALREILLEPEVAVTRTGYNAVGEPVYVLDALGNEQCSRQSLAGALSERLLKLAGADQYSRLVGDVHYNAAGQVVQQTAGNGVITRSTFQAESGLLSTLIAQVAGRPLLQSLAYNYDAVGNLISVTDRAQPIRYFRNERIVAVNTYRYDSLYQLIEASGWQRINAPAGPHLPEFVSPPDPNQLENYLQTYHYDESGNLLTMHHHAGSGQRTERTAVAAFSNRSLPYTANGDRPGEQEIAAGYDANGNLNVLQKGQNLRWGSRNQLLQVDQVVRADSANDGECYIYNGEGQRVRKIRTTDSVNLTRLHETRYLPGLEFRKAPEQTLHVISAQAGRCTVQVLHWERGRSARIDKDQQRYIFNDHLNSSTLELDADAQLISQEIYYPYGGTAWWAGRDKVEASYRTVRYSGQERDATGLYYYGFRYYLPWRQRWLSADPGGVHDGLNLYRMVGGNPIGFVDLQGLAKTRVTPTQRLKAIPSGVGRGIVKGAAGYAAKYVAKTVMKLAAQETLRSAAMVLSGASWAYASAGFAGHYLEAAGVSRISKGLGMGAAALGGLAAGVGVAFLSNPVDVLAEVAKNLGSGVTGRLISSVGGSIAYDGNATPRSQAVNVGADLAVNFGEGMLFSALPGAVPPILKSMSNGAMKSGLGDSIRSAASVPASYRESNPTFPTLEDMKTFGKGFLHDTAMSSVYGVGDVLINRGIGTALGNHVVDPVLRAGFENLQLAGQFDALVGERVLSGVGLHEVTAVPNVTTPRADTDRNLINAAEKRKLYKETRNGGQRLLSNATTSV
ncbi:RHS repeat-associated core domain-containing protein [Pseudomonas fluorescens]|uniref:RHS repeat-associated core domain-containing protein n=1 Tax=Pseudomonas fluorescens TaxID=294 RepID=UPI001131912B|nr:RHS repeat-associated core domain-containing protein [Pseudomonas fluorescens]TMU83053.1 RHS repeat-associated core domain-containing protein [Pseudomonas fluorescens]